MLVPVPIHNAWLGLITACLQGRNKGQGQDQGPLQPSLCPNMSACPLQSGTSRTHFEMWCEDRRNGVIIADFAVQGTLAREILGSPSEVMTRAGVKVRHTRNRA